MRNNVSLHGKLGFTLTEILIVIGVIAVLVAVLLPALSSAIRTGDMTKSMNNMKQIALWMRNYSTENREYIVPSQFNYTASAAPPPAGAGYPVKVRSHVSLQTSPFGNWQYKGTWTDILWTQNSLGSDRADLIDPGAPGVLDKYLYDSPDEIIFETYTDYTEYTFRSSAPNSKDFMNGAATGTGAKPFGTGAPEGGLPGYFAANNFFNADPAAPPYVNPNGTTVPTPANGRWYTTGQIRAPDRSLYAIDSFAGETIEPIDAPYDNTVVAGVKTIEVDFRYSGVCLMLLLDGHIDATQSPWDNLTELQNQRRMRVKNLDQ